MATTNFVDGTVVQADWLNDVDAHVYDQTTDAHDAANISFVPAGTIVATTVQAAIEEVATEAATPVASNVVFTPAGTIAATDVQAAIAELDTQVSDNLTATDAAIVAVKIKDQTPVATTSGTSIDIPSIPAGIKRLIVKLVGVSTNGTSDKVIQLGTGGGVVTTGYAAGVGIFDATTQAASAGVTTGFTMLSVLAADAVHGTIVFDLHGTDTWVASGSIHMQTRNAVSFVMGSIALGAALDRIRLTTAGGVNTFDAGAISVSWEF